MTKQIIGLVIAGLLQVSLFGFDLSDSTIKRGVPTDTVVVYDTVFEFSPQRGFPRSYLISTSYLPQNAEIRYGSWKAAWGYELYEMNSMRLNASRRFALDAKSYWRYRFLRSNLDFGLGVHYYSMDYYHNYYDYYRDEYINNERHVYERGGIVNINGEFITLGAQVNAHAEFGNFKKENSRLTLEANVGLYAYTSIISNESYISKKYDKHWIWYNNGERELVSATENNLALSPEQNFSKNDINYHLDFRLKCRVIDQLFAHVGLGYNGLTYNIFSNSNTTVGIQYLFGTKYGKRFE